MKTVYTFGVFDLLHPGHINLLKRAKEFGDTLVVGVIDDKSVSDFKGHDRPVQRVEDRIIVLESIRFVDQVVLQNGYNGVGANLKRFDVDVVVHGDDLDNLPSSFEGMNIVQIPYSMDYSTSEIIRRINR